MKPDTPEEKVEPVKPEITVAGVAVEVEDVKTVASTAVEPEVKKPISPKVSTTKRAQHFIAVSDRLRRATRIVSSRYEMTQPVFFEEMMGAAELYRALIETYKGLGEKNG